MSTIKNSSLKNVYGDGYEKKLIIDDGTEYTIKNSSLKNVYGDGHEKTIVKSNSNYNSSLDFSGLLIVGLITILLGIITFGLMFFICWLCSL